MNDQTSFRSYGTKPKQPPAQIGQYAAFAYASALNGLLKDKERRRTVGADSMVYWAEKGGGEQESMFGSLFDPPKEDEDGALSAVMQRIAKGEMAHDPGMTRMFYLLCLSPNAARISVRFFYESQFGDLIQNIQRHYDGLDIVGDGRTPFRYLPLWLILSETTVKKTQADAAPLLGGQLLHSILSGHAYPATLYSAILTRIRAGEGVNRVKAGVIKAFLLRKLKEPEEREVLTVALNEQSSNQPYVLGRLFATLEELQRVQADTKLNRTIYDSYFTSASSHPLSVFTSILQLSSHHMAKLRKTKPGYAVILDKRMNELMGKLAFEENSSPFPATLGYEEQGLFILGYYHQRAFRKDKNEEASDNEQQL
jgi:CRISPR-associated protein Csd1